MKKIAFIGAGEIGSAIFDLIKHKKNLNILRWDINPRLVAKQKSLEETVQNADVLFVCVPSKYVRDAIKSFKKFLSAKTVVVSISKGIELNSRETMDEVLKEELPKKQAFALLSGPMLGEELSDGLMGAGTIASKDKNAQKVLSDIFEKTNLKTACVSYTYGVALCGVFKNIYAIALGAFDALHYGSNSKGWLVSCALEEMEGMISDLNGEPEAVTTISGVGDLIATGFSAYSMNFTYGYERALNRGKKLDCEGKISLPSILKMLGKNVKKYPVLQSVKRIVIDGENTKKVLDELIYG